MKSKQEYLLSIPFDYLLRFIGHSYLVRPKNDYFTKKDFVRRIIRTLSAADCEWLYSMYIHNIPSVKAAELFLIRYPTATIVREAFVESILESVHDDIGEISYEFPITNTRIDIARIQGDSYAYEIKSIRDSSRRIEHQISTMKKIFEKTYLVLPKEKKLLSSISIDKKVGIYYYVLDDENIIFKKRRTAKKMTTFDSLAQLQLFSTDDLTNFYHDLFNAESGKMDRGMMEQKIMTYLPTGKINAKFKEVLKTRFHNFPNNNFNIPR